MKNALTHGKNRQAEYNRRYREKQAKIKRAARELDAAVAQLEATERPDRVTAAALLAQAEKARLDLRELEH